MIRELTIRMLSVRKTINHQLLHRCQRRKACIKQIIWFQWRQEAKAIAEKEGNKKPDVMIVSYQVRTAHLQATRKLPISSKESIESLSHKLKQTKRKLKTYRRLRMVSWWMNRLREFEKSNMPILIINMHILLKLIQHSSQHLAFRNWQRWIVRYQRRTKHNRLLRSTHMESVSLSSPPRLTHLQANLHNYKHQ